jgi:hypothetical protein
LEARGLITLPARRRMASRRLPVGGVTAGELWDPAPIHTLLADLVPLQLQVVSPGHPCHAAVGRLLARYHYVGYRGPVGENLAYLVHDRHGRDVACLLFGAPAWKSQPRDRFLGWDAVTRARRLSLLTNNTRFLILPWVRVPHLASHLLGRITRRLAADWQAKYGHPVYLVETFVQRDRFAGTCYRAANWTWVGQTQGRSRQDRSHTLRVPVKDIYVYPLTPRFRERLCHVDA